MARRALTLQRWQWHDPVYDVACILVRGPWGKARVWIDSVFGTEDDDMGAGHGAKAMWIEHPRGCAVVLWFPEWFTLRRPRHIGVLAHEAYHAAHFVLRDRGVTLSADSEEAVAYYITWMAEQVAARLQKRGK